MRFAREIREEREMSRENRIPLLFVVAGAMLLMMLIKANAGEPGANQRPTTEVMSPAPAPPPQPQWQPQPQQAPPQVYREVVREISLVTQYRYVEVEKPVYRDRDDYDRYDRYDRYRPSYRPSYRPRYDNYRPRYGGQSYHHHDHCD